MDFKILLKVFEHNDKLKYNRYNKVYDMLYFDEEIEMILHKVNQIFFSLKSIQKQFNWNSKSS